MRVHAPFIGKPTHLLPMTVLETHQTTARDTCGGGFVHSPHPNNHLPTPLPPEVLFSF